jgi:hypothetical protein
MIVVVTSDKISRWPPAILGQALPPCHPDAQRRDLRLFFPSGRARTPMVVLISNLDELD